jgi:hypothetical protein
MDLIALGYSYSRIIHDHYVRNWKDETGSSKLTISKRAVVSYHEATEIQKNVDPVFKMPSDPGEYDDAAKQWAHQIDKFFSPYETVKLPYSFGDHLVMALDEEYRKQCLVELDRKRQSIVGSTSSVEQDLMLSLQSTIKETSEAIQHLAALVPGGLEDDSDTDLLRGRQEVIEAIQALENGLALLNDELAKRNIEIVG